MKIDHIHFFVEDANTYCRWLTQVLDFELVTSQIQGSTQTELLRNGPVCFVLSAPLDATSPVAQFLQAHPPGVVDVALQVPGVAPLLQQVAQRGGEIYHPLQSQHPWLGDRLWGQIGGWGHLRHTLIEPPERESAERRWTSPRKVQFTGIDHVVLNVATGDLKAVVSWYQRLLGFQPQQVFSIQTEFSALYSQVMEYPGSDVKLPVNEPASANSQIQEFLDLNRGPGIQHIALVSQNLQQAIATLRQRQLALLSVPLSYYEQLRQRPGFCLSEADWRSLAELQILVDWHSHQPAALLLQTFTQPIFDQPTFFLEFIERQRYQVGNQVQRVSGFGEGNFQALFEAVEREQRKRGNLV